MEPEETEREPFGKLMAGSKKVRNREPHELVRKCVVTRLFSFLQTQKLLDKHEMDIFYGLSNYNL